MDENSLKLQLAVKDSNIDFLKKAVNSPSDYNFNIRFGPEERSLLYVAVLNSTLEVVQLLCEIRDMQVEPDIHLEAAAFCKDDKDWPEIVLSLIKNFDLDLNLKDSNHQTILDKALMRKDEVLINYILESEKFNPNVENAHGNTILHRLASAGSGDKNKYIERLIKHPQLSMAHKNHQGRTWIIELFRNHSSELNPIKRLVLENLSLPLDQVDEDGKGIGQLLCLTRPFPEDLFILFCSQKRAQLNYKDSQGRFLIHHLMKSKDATIKAKEFFLSQQSVDPNSLNEDGRSALHLCLIEKKFNEVECLLKHPQIDLNLKDDNKQLPLFWLIGDYSSERRDMLKKFIEFPQLKLDVYNRHGEGLLEMAYDQPEFIKVLCQRDDLPLTVRDDDTTSFLHKAINLDWLEGFEAAISSEKVDVNFADHKGRTPLHFAVYAQKIPFVRLILENPRVDINRLDANNLSALDLALDVNNASIINFLMEREDIDLMLTDKNGDPLIFSFAEKLNAKLIESLLEQNKISSNVRNSQGQTILHKAVEKNNIVLLRKLNECSSFDINSRDWEGRSALYLAIQERNIMAIQILLQNEKIDINETTVEGDPLIFPFIEVATPPLLQIYLNKGDQFFSARDIHGNTILHFAILHKKVELVSMMVSFKQLDMNARNNASQTPLHLAIAIVHPGIVNHLVIREDLDVNLKDLNSVRPIQYAIQSGNIGIVNSLLNSQKVDVSFHSKNGMPFLHYVFQETFNIEMVKLLIQSPLTDLNLIDSQGFSLLHHCVKKSNLEILELLLSFSADRLNRNLRANSGVTALEMALIDGNQQVIKVLFGCPHVELDQCDHLGISPLMKVVQTKHLENFKTLITSDRIDLNHLTNDQKSLFHIIVESNHEEILQEFFKRVKQKVNLNQKDKTGSTAFHVAVKQGKIKLVKQFLENCSAEESERLFLDINVSDQCKNTPLHSCVIKNNPEILKLILDFPSVDRDRRNEDQKSAFDLAQENGLEEMTNLLDPNLQ